MEVVHYYILINKREWGSNMRNKKRILYVSSGLVIFLILMLFIYLSTFLQPKIVFTTQINKISDEDYKKRRNEGKVQNLGNGGEKIRDIKLQIKVVTPFGLINSVKIDRDQAQPYLLQQCLIGNDKVLILGGGYAGQGNGKEYDESMEVYLANLSENEFRSIIGETKIKIKWHNIWNSENYKNLYIKDSLK